MDRLARLLSGARRGAAIGADSLWSNAPLMVLSLGLATILWVFVTNQENPSLRKDVSFQLASFEPLNVPKSMLVTSETPNDVLVTLIGPRGSVNAVRTEDIQLRVDLAGADSSNAGNQAANYIAPVKATVKKRDVRAEVEPSTVRVTVEPVAHKTVPVKINQIDALPVGFELDSQPAADPSEVSVSGLKQNVDAVDAVYGDLRLGSLSVSTTVTLSLSTRSQDGRAISGVPIQPATAAVKVNVKRTVFNRDAFVAVQIHGKPANGYQVVAVQTDPPNATIAGSLDTLNSITSVPTDPVEIEGATQDVRRGVELRPPTGVTVVNPPRVTVTISIIAARGPGSVLVAPRTVGLAPGLSAQVLTPSLTVSFTGPLPQILTLKPGDVSATIDLSNLGVGGYSVDPKITLPSGLDRDSVSPAKVDLVLSTGPASVPAR